MAAKTFRCGACGASVAEGKHCGKYQDRKHRDFAQKNGYLYKQKGAK